MFEVHGARLHGTVHAPANRADRRDPGVLILNSDDGCRLGPHRLWVRLAERVSDLGFPCLRFDYRGCGDSEGPEGPPPADVGLEDAMAANAYLLESMCLRTTVLVGICYGAEIALLANQSLDSVIGVVACSTGRYITHYRQGGAFAHTDAYLAGYKSKLLSWNAWRKFVHGQVNTRLIASGFWRTLRPQDRRRDQEGAAAVRARMRHQTRRVPRLFIYGQADPLTSKYMPDHEQEALRQGVDHRFHVIRDADHNYSSVVWSQELIDEAAAFVQHLCDRKKTQQRASV
ncbi:MAG TPA: alpha/beta fold hydrolase [Phycisphaerae bacterium]|nr:alpha/beta fold hydrolase [Phycisphaerae bacterium]